MLFVIPTPIGNLEDMSFRAIRLLKEVDLILAEDTRVTQKLLAHYTIETPLRSYHAHNEHNVTPQIVEMLQTGATIALVSDAGTPGISDPGFLLIRACKQNNLDVQCLPGPTAFVPALVASGLPANRFFFEGFLPHKKGRQTRLRFLAELQESFILYESPNRLIKCLEQLGTFCGAERPASVSRELSKLHEETKTATLGELAVYFGAKSKVKGEIVIVVAGKPPTKKKK